LCYCVFVLLCNSLDKYLIMFVVNEPIHTSIKDMKTI